MFNDTILGVTSFFMAVISAFIKSGNVMLGFILALISIVLFTAYIFMLIKNRNTVNIKAHPFWSRMKYFSSTKVLEIDIDNPIRKRMYIKAVRIFINNTVSHTEEVLASKFRAEVATCLMGNIIDSYENEWRKNYIPERFIQQFNFFHKSKLKYTIRYIEFVSTSNFYKDDVDKKVAILDGLLHLFQWLLIDLESVHKEMNGELDKCLKVLSSEGKI